MDGSLERADLQSRLFTDPKPARTAGLAAISLAFYLCLALTAIHLNWWALWLIPLLIGLISAGAAVAIAPSSPGNVAWAGAGTALAFVVAHWSKWDISAPFLMGTMSIVAFVAAFLLVLPRVKRRVVVSAFIVFHFGGILCANAAAAPQPWVAGQLFEVLFRPCLQAVYLAHAYRWFAPEPPAATPFLWFRLEFEPDSDGKRFSRWVKIPNFDAHGRGVDFDAVGNPRRLPCVATIRRQSMVYSASVPGNASLLEKYKNNRLIAGQARGIPTVPNQPLEAQFREPSPAGKLWLSMYVRHVARKYQHELEPQKPVVSVKVYQVSHEIIRPHEVTAGRSWDDPTTYHAFYQGEYDPDGRMKKSCREVDFDADGYMVELHRDPFLYFEIPIVAEATLQIKKSGYKVTNYLRKHAGDSEGDHPP